MPIYAYRCTGCGFEKDVMRKVSDPLLTTCPECNTENFAKQLTAPGFHLKGSGWYATDFKHSGAGPAAKTAGTGAAAGKADSKTETSGAGESKSDGKPAAPPASTATPAASASVAKAE